MNSIVITTLNGSIQLSQDDLKTPIKDILSNWFNRVGVITVNMKNGHTLYYNRDNVILIEQFVDRG